MKERWLPVGVLAGVLFVLNVAQRWAAKLVKDEDSQAIAGLVVMGVVVLLFLIPTVIWGRKRPIGRVAADLGAAAGLGIALSIFIGPLPAGENPFGNGAGAFFAQVWHYAALIVGGVGAGFVGLVAFAADYRSKQLKTLAAQKRATPKRV